MERVKNNNLGLTPLAGICSYERACSVGYDIDRSVSLLKRYVYVETQLTNIYAAHIAHVPEWEVKCASGLHMWLDAEHSAMLRKRITEMREPPHYLDKTPDAVIELFFQELIRSQTTLELMVGIYGVAKKELIRSLNKHLAETNPLVDHPTCRILKFMLIEEEEMQVWGEKAIQALMITEEDRIAAQQWQEHLQCCLQAAGGFSGELEKSANWSPITPRTVDGKPYEMKDEPRRDARFVDKYNFAGKIDDYYLEETRPSDERTYALIYKRLKEMTVPEWMGPIIYKTQGKPWDYYVDMSRQLWDEARHSMLGEVGLYQDGVEFYKYPIDFRTSLTLNTKFEPLEAHMILWYFEQRQMPKKTGKRLEWVIAKSSDNELAQTFQDYDWADEVLHTQIGRKWLVPEIGGLEELKKKAEELLPRIVEERAKLDERSDQKQWWPEFLAEIRAGRERIRDR
jgi:hypothetical protein